MSTPSALEKGDVAIELTAPMPPLPKPTPPPNGRITTLIWMFINTASTVGIVFINKAVFSQPDLRDAQVLFAAFHFLCTFVTLTVMSSVLGVFEPRRVSIRSVLPLSIAFCANVLLPNAALARCSVPTYQLLRVLVTPATAAIGTLLYSHPLSRARAIAIVPVCAGVALTTIADASAHTSTATTVGGVVLAVGGVCASAVYTLWIGHYREKVGVSAMQLLACQAPVSAVMLVALSPFVDRIPVAVPPKITLPIMSGALAVLINVSQFQVVQRTSPLTSTVLGHAKTLVIVAVGWSVATVWGGRGGSIPGKGVSLVGMAIALVGIAYYSLVQHRESRNAHKQTRS
ncbi:hypothetical protein PYCC9005_000932 [Savitreella phatthalungensis]